MTTKKMYAGLMALLLCLLLQTAQAQEVLTNQLLIQMSQMNVSSDVMNAKIRASRNSFDLTTNGLLQLLTAKVSTSVLETMLQGVTLTDVMTNEDVIKLWDTNLSRKLLTQKINASRSRFDMTTGGLIQLKTGKVPDAIVKIMMVAPVSGPSPILANPAVRPASVPARPVKASAQAENEADMKGIRCNSWTDKFTKKNVTVSRAVLRGVKASNILLGRSASTIAGIEDMQVSLLFRRDGLETVLVLYASKPGINDLVVTRNKPLLLLMSDESVMEFKPIMDAEFGTNFDYVGYTIDTNLCVYYAINQEQLKTLSKKLVKDYRLHTYNRNYHEDTVNENRAEQVQAAARCMLK